MEDGAVEEGNKCSGPGKLDRPFQAEYLQHRGRYLRTHGKQSTQVGGYVGNRAGPIATWQKHMVSLKRLRQEKGLSQRRLAQMAHVSVMTVSRAELGRFKPSPSTVHAIAGVLEVDTDEIDLPLATNIDRLQVKRGLDDSMLCKKAGISRHALRRLRSPGGHSNAGTIMNVAEALKVSAAEVGRFDKGNMSDWRKLRLEKRLTVTELAKRTGVSRQTIYSVEEGHSSPSTTTIARLASVLDTELIRSNSDMGDR